MAEPITDDTNLLLVAHTPEDCEISEQDLAYLNENLDIVDVYLHTEPTGYAAPVRSTHHAIDVVRTLDPSYASSDHTKILIRTQIGFYSYSINWRLLLEYVREHANYAVPLLK